MPYLIDGYNLLHALGILHGRVGPKGLEKARGRLLGLLSGSFGAAPADVTVVFDAAQAPKGIPERQDFEDMQVLFAVHREQADDLIEELIQHHSDPRHLVVVSDDHRIQRAGRRRACIVRGCLDFLEELQRHRQAQRAVPAEPPEKAENLSPAERDRWLAEFGDLAADPGFKELFEPYDFDDPREGS